MFFIHRFSNGTKVINKGHLELFSLPNVHYAEKVLPDSNKRFSYPELAYEIILIKSIKKALTTFL